MSEGPKDPKMAGFEAVVAYNWGVGRISSEAILLNLSHPRHGGLSYVIPDDMARALIARMQEVLATTGGQQPAPFAPTLQ